MKEITEDAENFVLDEYDYETELQNTIKEIAANVTLKRHDLESVHEVWDKEIQFKYSENSDLAETYALDFEQFGSNLTKAEEFIETFEELLEGKADNQLITYHNEVREQVQIIKLFT